MSEVDRRVEASFARIALQPVASPDGVRQVLVLEPVGLQLPPRPEPAAEARADARRPGAPRGALASEGARHDHAAQRRPAAAAGQPAVHLALTLLVALALQPDAAGAPAGLPDLLALALVFWNVHQPRRVGVGLAFVFGLLMDVHDGAVLGQHALAYTLLSFFAITIHRRLLWFACRRRRCRSCRCSSPRMRCRSSCGMIAGGMFPGWQIAARAGVRIAALAAGGWLLLAPQRRPPDPDQNRPL